MIRALVVALSFGVLLAGCQTTPVSQLSYSEVNALAEEIAQRCADQGISDEHPQLEACIRHEVNRETESRELNAQRRIAFGAALGAMGSSMQNQPRPVTCSTSYTPSGILGRPPVGSYTTCR